MSKYSEFGGGNCPKLSDLFHFSSPTLQNAAILVKTKSLQYQCLVLRTRKQPQCAL